MIFLLIVILFLSNVTAQDYTQLQLPEGAKARIGKGTINDIKFSPDGNWVAVAGSIGVWLYNAHIGAEVALFTGHTQSVLSVAFSPDGKTLASGSWDTTIRLWDVETQQHKASLTQHTYGIWAVAFSPDGKTLASSSPGSIRLWDVETGQHKARLKTYTGRAKALAFSPDGGILANIGQELPLTRTRKNYPIQLWDVATSQHFLTLEGHTSEIEAVAFSSDGKTLVSASWDRTIRLWDVNTGDQLSTFMGNSDWLTAVVFSPDGRTIVSGSRRGEVRLWNANTGQRTGTLSAHPVEVSDIVFSSDGTTFNSAGLDGTIRAWDASGGQLQETTLKGHTDHLTAMALSPNGRILASGSSETPILLWNTDTAQLQQTLKGHTKRISALAFSPDGKVLVSVSGDETIRLWNMYIEQSSLVVDPQPRAILIDDTIGFRAVAFSPGWQNPCQ